MYNVVTHQHLHIFFGDFEVECVEILFDSLFIR